MDLRVPSSFRAPTDPQALVTWVITSTFHPICTWRRARTTLILILYAARAHTAIGPGRSWKTIRLQVTIG